MCTAVYSCGRASKPSNTINTSIVVCDIRVNRPKTDIRKVETTRYCSDLESQNIECVTVPVSAFRVKDAFTFQISMFVRRMPNSYDIFAGTQRHHGDLTINRNYLQRTHPLTSKILGLFSTHHMH